MVTASDFAIKAGAGAKIHDLTIAGFDNCIYAQGASRLVATNVHMDCSVGFYASQGGGQTDLLGLDAQPFLTRQVGAIKNEEYWNIVGVTPSTTMTNAAGHPVCHLSLQAVDSGDHLHHPLFSVSDLPPTGATSDMDDHGDPYRYPLWVAKIGMSGDVGGYSCNTASTMARGSDSAWAMSVTLRTPSSNYASDVAEVDLIGSDYGSDGASDACGSESSTNGYCVHSTATWPGASNVINIAGPIANISPGMKVYSSGTGFPASTPTVIGIVPHSTGDDPNDGYDGAVILSAPLTAPSGSTPVAVVFDNGPHTPGVATACDISGDGRCVFLNAAQRYLAGESPAGNGSARLPASRGGRMGAGFLLDNVAGPRALNTFSFAHYYNIAAIDSNACTFFQLKSDDNGELDPGNTTNLYDAGSSRGCIFVGNAAGPSNNVIVLDTYGTLDAAVVGATGMDALGHYGTSGTLHYVTVGSTSSFATPGVMHVCAAETGAIQYLRHFANQ